MDFADATLVLLAEEVGVTEILTLDRRGFSTYRTAKGRDFASCSKKPAGPGWARVYKKHYRRSRV